MPKFFTLVDRHEIKKSNNTPMTSLLFLRFGVTNFMLGIAFA